MKYTNGKITNLSKPETTDEILTTIEEISSNNQKVSDSFDAMDNKDKALDAKIDLEIGRVDGRITNIITTPISGAAAAQEVVDARQSAVKGTTYASLDSRLEAAETDIEKTKSPAYSTPIDVSAPIFTIPADCVPNSQLSDVKILGRSLKSETNYNRDTWAEWTKSAGVVGDSTGLEFTTNGTSSVYAYLSANFKPSTKYGMLYSVISNTIAGPFGFDGSTFGYTTIDKTVGNNKKILTSASNIAINKVHLYNQTQTETAGNKIKLRDIRIFELPAGSEIEGDFNTLTADQLATKYPYIKGGVVVSTLSTRLKSESKNRFNKSTITLGKVFRTDTGYQSDANFCVSDYIKILPGGVYTITKGTGSSLYGCAFYDVNKVVISYFGTASGGAKITAPLNAHYIRISTQISLVDSQQFEEGAAATAYEPFKSGGEIYTNGVLNSVGNAKDEFNGDGTLIQNVSNTYTLQSSDFENYDPAPTNHDVIYFKAFNPGIVPSKSGSGQLGIINFFNDTRFNYLSVYTGAEQYGHYTTSDGKLRLVVPKGTYANQVAAAAALAGASMIYQLSKQVETQYPPQSLRVFPNGTVIVEPGVIKEDNFYDGGITVNNPNYPIKEIEQLWKVVGNGETPIEPSKAVFTVGATSFTITGALRGEKYRYVYKTTASSTQPTIRYSYALNISANLAKLNDLQAKLSAELGDVWMTMLPLADKELAMFMLTAISVPASATTADCANKINEIINAWKG